MMSLSNHDIMFSKYGLNHGKSWKTNMCPAYREGVDHSKTVVKAKTTSPCYPEPMGGLLLFEAKKNGRDCITKTGRK